MMQPAALGIRSFNDSGVPNVVASVHLEALDNCQSCKEKEKKRKAPFLSSWILCLQAELVFGGWHPLFPEQMGEDLEKQGHPWKKNRAGTGFSGKGFTTKKPLSKTNCSGMAEDVSCFKRQIFTC